MLKVINDSIFDFVVTLCILLNTVFLAIEHHGMGEDLQYVLDMGNKVCHDLFYAYLTIFQYFGGESEVLSEFLFSL